DTKVGRSDAVVAGVARVAPPPFSQQPQEVCMAGRGKDRSRGEERDVNEPPRGRQQGEGLWGPERGKQRGQEQNIERSKQGKSGREQSGSEQENVRRGVGREHGTQSDGGAEREFEGEGIGEGDLDER